MAVLNRFSALEDLAERDDPVTVPIVPTAVKDVSRDSSFVPDKKTQIFVGHIKTEGQWNVILAQAANLGKIKSNSRLIPSKIHGYSFGFITMVNHQHASCLIQFIGQDKWDTEYVYNCNNIQCISVRQLYTDWVVEDKKKKKK